MWLVTAVLNSSGPRNSMIPRRCVSYKMVISHSIHNQQIRKHCYWHNDDRYCQNMLAFCPLISISLRKKINTVLKMVTNNQLRQADYIKQSFHLAPSEMKWYHSRNKVVILILGNVEKLLEVTCHSLKKRTRFQAGESKYTGR